jgi:Prim-pol 4/Herpesviridae UL52/UL70 DNA primase
MSIERWMVPHGPGTHVLMSGGILCVPPEETQDFYREYIQAINLGSKLYVVEQKTESFKFFVDLDYKAPEKLSDEDLVQFCSIIHKSLETSSPCLISKARPRSISEGLIKSGVHIHWPNLTVSRTQAMNLRSKIVSSLAADFPFDWDKVIDSSVYGGSGLRMLWSHKKPAGDPYVPWRSLDGREFSKTPDVETLALFAIRTEEDPTTGGEVALGDTGPLEDFVQKYMEGQSKAQVKKVQRHEHNGWYVQTDSKFCERIRKEHKSNHVWFHIASRRISQRCFDEECAEFKGTEHILPPSIVEQLHDVAIVGSPPSCFLMDIFPNGSRESVQKVRSTGPPVLGAGPGKLAKVSGQSPHVRTVGFDPFG